MKPNKLTPDHNLMWESSRFMLPEHVDALRQYNKESQKKQRPEVDDQAIQEIAWKLRMSRDYTLEVEITVFGEYEDRMIVGIIDKIDIQLQRVKVTYGEEYEWIAIGDILGVENI